VPFYRGVPLTTKALKSRGYAEIPATLGEHLRKRRKELGLLQREAAIQMGIGTETYANWEKDNTEPIAAQFRPVLDFLGYDPMPAPTTLAERVQTKRRELGVTFEQVAGYLGWDAGSLTRYLNGTWRLPNERAEALEQFLGLSEQDASEVSRMPRRRR
jgi:transcriptional regulator with XRE-family HTH domain